MRKLSVFVVILAIVSACSPKPAEQTSDSISKLENGLVGEVYFEGDSLWNIEDRMKHYGIPGASIAVIYDNKIVFSKAYGVMDRDTKEPVTTSTLFQAGSISKPVAAYGALKTVETGKINLTDDVNTWLTTWKIPGNEFTKEKKVTLEHLVSHTGGLTVHGFWGYSPDLAVPALVQVLDGTPPANSPPIRVDKTPGGAFRYSGGGYTIMQQMLIDVYGKSFPEIEKELVLDPLQMNSSTYDQPLDSMIIKKAATGYLPNGDQTKGKRHTYPEMAAAGLWTTAEDLAKFVIDVQQGVKGESKVISKAMAERLLTPINGGPTGLGLFIDNHEGSIYFGHDGWDEGFSSEMTAHKNKGYGVVVLINANQPPFISEVIRSVARAYNWDNKVPEYKKLAMDTSVFRSVVGRYRNGTDGRITISSEGNKLFFKYIRRPKPEELVHVNDSTYVPMYTPAEIQFKKLPDGQTDLVISNDDQHAGSHLKISETEFVPLEYVLAGDFDNALKGYQALLKADPNDNSVNEDNLNSQGYGLLHDGKTQSSLVMFKVNTILYPNSFNVYDSYADALKDNGDTREAIANYKKALKLNPKNEESAKKLAELENVSKK